MARSQGARSDGVRSAFAAVWRAARAAAERLRAGWPVGAAGAGAATRRVRLPASCRLVLQPLETRLLFSDAVHFQVGSSFSVGAAPAAVLAVDVNGDGNLDFVTADKGTSTVSVALGRRDGTFAPAVTYAVGASPVSAAAGDFNGDGKLDLAVADSGSSAVTVLLGDGQGHFTHAPGADLPVTSAPHQVVVGDFNHDGRPDLATANDPGTNGIHPALGVFVGNGDGTFQAARSTTLHNYWENYTSLAVADFNADGNPDVVMAGMGHAGRVITLLGNGDGTFAAPLYIYLPAFNGGTDNTASSLAAGDLNGDGRADVAVVGGALGPNAVNVLQGNGDGTFAAAGTYVAPAGPSSVTLADVNGDGSKDLLVTDGDTAFLTAVGQTGAVSVFLNDGTGHFNPQDPFGAGNGPSAVAAGDFNRDGRVDVITANAPDNNVSLLLGYGDGTFAAPRDYYVLSTQVPGGLNPTQLTAAADFTGDGKPDLAVIANNNNNTAGTLEVFPGRGDGTFAAQVTTLLPFSPFAVTSGDLNGDGRQDVVVTSNVSDTVGVYPGHGDGTFATPATYTLPAQATAVTLADVNGDGKPDVIVGFWNSVNVAVLLNDGGGGLLAPRLFNSGGNAQGDISLALADLDGRNGPDLVVGGFARYADVLLNLGIDGGGNWLGFGPPVYLGTTIGGPAVLADFNGDGKTDVATLTRGYIQVWLGNGDGTFAGPRLFPFSPTDEWAFATADFNGDGRPDLATADGHGGTVSLLLNRGGTGAGWLGLAAPLAVTAGSWVFDVAAADFNRDGRPDLAVASYAGDNVTVLVQDQPPAGVSAGGPYAASQGAGLTLSPRAWTPRAGA